MMMGMNIKEAKEQMKDAVRLYLKKDEDGSYYIPINKQRPILLLGAPGLGKTAIMEQIAGELGIALVSYSMTHHTRQSALGLPVIEQEEYDGKTYEISRYTMSEIIATVYEVMKTSGKKEGILFLDEINCISETLTPSMLLFLQYKVFGSYRVPEGWVVITAGNPPEYNRAVREFDVVTLDRMRVMSIEPDYEVFREYAMNKGIHPAVTTYMDIKKEHFYTLNRGIDGQQYVTARGWEDLSEMIKLSELEQIRVEESLVFQYLHHKEIAEEFFSYYQLFRKYREDYKIEQIRKGTVSEAIKSRAKEAAFDERIALMSLLLDALSMDMARVMQEADCLSELSKYLKESLTQADAVGALHNCRIELEKEWNARKNANTFTKVEQKKLRQEMDFFDKWEQQGDGTLLDGYRELLQARIEMVKARKTQTQQELTNVFTFVEEIFGDGQELLFLVTELSIRKTDSLFLATFGCEAYTRKSNKLAFSDRSKELSNRWNRLEKMDDSGI